MTLIKTCSSETYNTDFSTKSLNELTMFSTKSSIALLSAAILQLVYTTLLHFNI